MIVYRVEHESIKNQFINFPVGPCIGFAETMDELQTDELADAYQRAIDALRRHLNSDRDRYRTPAQDANLGWIDWEQVCGVDSTEAVHDWFGDALPLLEKVGFHVAKYDVPDWAVKCGWAGQVVFNTRQAHKIEETTDERQDA